MYVFKPLPISYDLISKHINGELTLALYPIRSDKAVRYTAIEINIKKRVLKENIRNTAYLRYLEERTLGYAISLMKIAYQIDIPSYIDYSGGFSFRLWFFFKEFMHFLKIREFLKRFIEQAPSAPTYISVDPFIGTKGVGIGWIEHPILLPFGINRMTKKRALFLDDEGNPYPDQLMFLKRIQEISFKECLNKVKRADHMNHQSSERSFPITIENILPPSEIIIIVFFCAGVKGDFM
jgi:hypothetical protein